MKKRVIIWERTAERSVAIDVDEILYLNGSHRDIAADLKPGTRRLYVNRDNIVGMLVKPALSDE